MTDSILVRNNFNNVARRKNNYARLVLLGGIQHCVAVFKTGDRCKEDIVFTNKGSSPFFL